MFYITDVTKNVFHTLYISYSVKNHSLKGNYTAVTAFSLQI